MPRIEANSSRHHLERFVQSAAEATPAGACVLDAGAGDCMYSKHFAHARYESADFLQVEKPYAPVTYVCDLAEIPVDDARYDVVLLTQVLEHLPEPRRVLAELARVLKPGGRLWLSTPLFYEEHEQPYDFFRYTQFSLRRLAEEAGFHVERIDWLEGYLGTLGYQLQMAGRVLPKSAGAYGGGAAGRARALAARVARPLARYTGRRLNALDARSPYTAGGMPKNYTLVAVRN